MNIQQQTLSHWNWLKSISRELLALDRVPLFGTIPPFDFQKFSNEFSKLFNVNDLSVDFGETCWREALDIYGGISAPFEVTSLAVAGVDGPLFFVMATSDIEFLMQEILHLRTEDVALLDKEYVDSFARFLQLEALFLVNSIGFDKKLAIKMTEKVTNTPLEEPSLCYDIWLHIGPRRILSRLIMSTQFRASFYALSSKTFGTKPKSEHLAQFSVGCSIEAARCRLTLAEWRKVRPGDLFLFDHLEYDPDTKQAKCTLTLSGKPLFSAELEENKLKIIETSLHHEVPETMQENMQEHMDMEARRNIENNDQETEHEEESFLEGEEGKEGEEEDEADLFEEKEGEGEEEDAFDLYEEEPKEETQATPQTEDVPQEPTVKAQPEPQNVEVEESTEALFAGPISLKEIPITLSCELAQIQISVQKLLELSPGNILDLELAHDNNVLLVANGKIVGKGEIIKIGETLGVRIMDIGAA